MIVQRLCSTATLFCKPSKFETASVGFIRLWFIDGTNNVKKSALDRHMDTSTTHKIATEHHKPSTLQHYQEAFI